DKPIIRLVSEAPAAAMPEDHHGPRYDGRPVRHVYIEAMLRIGAVSHIQVPPVRAKGGGYIGGEKSKSRAARQECGQSGERDSARHGIWAIGRHRWGGAAGRETPAG